MNAPSVIVLVLLLAGLVAPLSWLTYLVFILPIFAAMAVLPPAWLGGINLTPGSFAAALFIIKAMTMPGIFTGSLRALSKLRLLGWLGLFLLVAVIGAYILPRLFQGSVLVFSMRAHKLESVSPSMSNLAQTAYLTLSVFSAAVFCSILRRRPEFVETVLNAVVFSGCVIIITGLVDIIAHATGHGDMLKIFYTADYSYSTGEILGARRVMGLTPEPATFGGMCAGCCAFLIFLRPVYPRHMQQWKVPLVGWGCAVMAFMSESSTAFIAMFVTLVLYVFYDTHSISAEGKVVRKSVTRKMFWACAIIGILPIIVFIDSDLFTYFGDLLNTLIFQKHNTLSYMERSSWTAAGLDAFFDSYGLGVGVGSVRTSNFFVNILASTGLPGAMLFFTFLTMLYMSHAAQRDSRDEAIIKAIKLVLLPSFTIEFLAGTTPDFGASTGALFGIIAALSVRAYSKSSTEQNPA